MFSKIKRGIIQQVAQNKAGHNFGRETSGALCRSGCKIQRGIIFQNKAGHYTAAFVKYSGALKQKCTQKTQTLKNKAGSSEYSEALFFNRLYFFKASSTQGLVG